jgi:O-antigen/teichoic acid export membrane protein
LSEHSSNYPESPETETVAEGEEEREYFSRLSTIGKTILAGASAALILRAGGAGLKYLLEILFARWLGPEEYGAFAYAYTWAQLLSVLAGLGLVTTVLRFVPKYESNQQWGHLRGLIGRSQQLTVAAGCGVLLAGGAVLSVVSYAHSTTLMFGLASVIPMALINVQSSLIRGRKLITAAFLGRYILWPVGGIAVVYALTVAGEQPTGAMAMGGMLGVLVAIAAGQVFLVRTVFPSPTWESRSQHSHTRRWILVSIPLLLMSGFQIVLNRADIIMVGTLMGATEAGFYNAAARTGGLIAFILTAFNAIAAPMISDYWSNREFDKLESLITTVIQWAFWPSLLLAVGMSVWSPTILRLFGREFESAWFVLVLVGAGQLVNATAGPVGYLMGLTGHERESAWVFGVSAVLNIVLNLVLIPAFGMAGGAIATMTTLMLWNLWLIVLVKKRIGISIFAAWRRALLFQQ